MRQKFKFNPDARLARGTDRFRWRVEHEAVSFPFSVQTISHRLPPAGTEPGAQETRGSRDVYNFAVLTREPRARIKLAKLFKFPALSRPGTTAGRRESRGLPRPGDSTNGEPTRRDRVFRRKLAAKAGLVATGERRHNGVKSESNGSRR